MSAILKGIQHIVQEQVSSILYELSEKYGFSYEAEYDAFLAKFTLSNQTHKIKLPKPLKEKTLKDKPIKEKTSDSDKSPNWKLPFNGTIYPSLCHAICRADGLYIQCRKNHLDDSDLCKTCQNYMLKNDKLPYGRIEQRAECGLYDFRFGKYAPLPYSIYMKKHQLSRETVQQYAATLGITLDEQHFQEVQEPPKKKGGRKPKSPIQVVNATNDNHHDNDNEDIRAIMEDIFHVRSDNEDNSDSDSDDSDSGLQFSKKSTPLSKQPLNNKSKKIDIELPKQPVIELPKQPVIELSNEPVVSKETPKKSKKNENEQPVKKNDKKSKKNDNEPTTASKKPAKVTAPKKSKKTDKEQPPPKESGIELVHTTETIEPANMEPANKEPANMEPANKEPAKEIQVTGTNGQIWTIPVEPAIPLLQQPVKPVTVKKITYNGVKYLRNSADNSIFDLEHNHVGTFDPATQIITFFQQDDDDDDDDEDEEEEDDDDE
jgi:hypothetical protein